MKRIHIKKKDLTMSEKLFVGIVQEENLLNISFDHYDRKHCI